MNDKWKKGINDLQKTGLTKVEKDLVFRRIMSTTVYQNNFNHYFKTIYYSASFVRYALILLIFVLSAGVVMASESSLPGNILYPIKTNVTEPVRGFVKTRPEAKAKWEVEKVTKRLEEAQKLIEDNKFDEKKQKEVEKLIDHHLDEFNTVLNSVSTSSDLEVITDLDGSLEDNLSAHSDILEKFTHEKIEKKEKREKGEKKSEKKNEKVEDMGWSESQVNVDYGDDNFDWFSNDNLKGSSNDGNKEKED